MTILDHIVSNTRGLVHQRKSEIRLRDLEDSPLFDVARKPFHEALSRPGISVIAEIKKASPSKGLLREQVDVAALASIYEESGAAAISVLTEPYFFRGSPDDLRIARAATRLPLLRKDFIIDPFQLVEARACGADAVLLIATVLERSQLRDLLQAAEELGVDHLVEVYRVSDLDKIDFDIVRTVGANNRDLDTFEVDVGRAVSVLRQVPEGIVRVAESGIRTPEDLMAAADGGVDAVLVGEGLMTSDDPGEALRKLLSYASDGATQDEPGAP